MPMPSPINRLDTSRSDQAACRQLLRHGSRSFYASSLLMPQPYRDAAVSLYAFCRIADDAIDLSPEPQQALLQLQRRLDGIYSNRPHADPADRTLTGVVREFGIPRTLLDALLEGFAWDCATRRYETLEDVRAYGARVAGVVGVMMALLMGERDMQVLARAADLGVAMQLTNIARDVGEDARNGRIYLPLGWLREAGIDPDRWLDAPAHSEVLGDIIERLLQEADRLYARSEAGIASLPRGCQPCVMTARLLYAEIGEEVRRRHHDAIASRAVVSPARKCRVVAGLGRLGKLPLDQLDAPALPETRFLLDAVAASPLPAVSGEEPAGKVEWMMDMFAELQRRDQLARTPTRNGVCPLLIEE
ncbi:MAG: phytoene/squalene synthase family protein [Halieaceae bacterium]|nr:phytoene/squalene synthase family protein [Halieaceae bacterium]